MTSPHPYIPNTNEDRRAMLDVIGVATADELFADIPPELRIDALDLPPEAAAEGTELTVDVRGKPLKVRVVPRPFYRRPQAEERKA